MVLDRLDDPRAIPKNSGIDAFKYFSSGKDAWVMTSVEDTRFSRHLWAQEDEQLTVPEECRHGAKHHAVEERQATTCNEF